MILTLKRKCMQIAHVEDKAARVGEFKETRQPLSSASRCALNGRGIDRLFKHQAEAIDAAVAGKLILICIQRSRGLHLLARSGRLPTLGKVCTPPSNIDQTASLQELYLILP